MRDVPEGERGRDTTSGRVVSDAGLAFIKAHEGFRARPTKLADGRWLIGFSSIDDVAIEGEISPEEAEERLKRDLEPVTDAVNALVFAPLTQGQFDALVSLGFSIGVEAFKTCGVAEALNDGRPIDAAAVFDAWRQAQVGDAVKPVDALVRRRAAEKAMFLELESGPVAASSALLRPRADGAAKPATSAPTALGLQSAAASSSAPDPLVIERIAKILPPGPQPAATEEPEPVRGGDNRVADLAGARMRARAASPFPPAPYPLRRGTSFPGALKSTSSEGAPGFRAGAGAARTIADWAEQWPWFLMGGGLALLAIGAVSLRSGGADAALANLGWLLGIVFGALALAAGGYHAARRVAGLDE